MGLIRKKVPEEIDAASLISMESVSRRPPPREGDRLMADIERMKAEIDSLKELREANSQRLSEFNEKIGEIRAMITSRERQMEEMGNKVTQATDILNAIKAQDVIKLMAKNEMAMSGLEARIDANTDVIKSLMQQTKEIKEKQNVFKGTEVVKELNDQIRGELSTIKKIESRVDINASKVEKMFNDVEGKYKDFLRAKSLADSMEKEFRILKKDFDSTKVEMSNVYNQSDFENFKTNVLNQINALVSGYRELRTGGGKDTIPKETVDLVRNNVFQVDINTKDIKTVQKRLDDLRAELSASKETVSKLPATFPTMEDLQKRIDLAVQQTRPTKAAVVERSDPREIKLLQKSIEDIQNQLKEMDSSEIETLHSEIDGLKSALKSMPSGKNDELRDEIDSLKADISKVKIPINADEIRKAIEETKESMENIRSQAAGGSGKGIDDLRMKMAEMEARVSRSRDTGAIDSRIFKMEEALKSIKDEQDAQLASMRSTLYKVCEQVQALSSHMSRAR